MSFAAVTSAAPAPRRELTRHCSDPELKLPKKSLVRGADGRIESPNSPREQVLRDLGGGGAAAASSRAAFSCPALTLSKSSRRASRGYLVRLYSMYFLFMRNRTSFCRVSSDNTTEALQTDNASMV